MILGFCAHTYRETIYQEGEGYHLLVEHCSKPECGAMRCGESGFRPSKLRVERRRRRERWELEQERASKVSLRDQMQLGIDEIDRQLSEAP